MSEAEKPNSSPIGDYDDPSTKIWAIYISEAEKRDRALIKSWQSDMDAMIIFSGLFSGIVAGFIIESYPTLQPDPTDQTNMLLAQILAAVSNNSQPMALPVPPDPSQFQPTNPMLVCNALWFISLSFGIACALSATFIQQWGRNYLEAIELCHAPHKRARVRQYLSQGFKVFLVPQMVELIPMLLHITGFFFFAGLVEFLFPINPQMQHLIIIILAIFSVVYTMINVLAVIFGNCPYRTPFSTVLRFFVHAFRLLQKIGPSASNRDTTVIHRREELAMAESPLRDERDLVALKWTLKTLTDDCDLEPFVDGISDFLSAFQDAEIKVMHYLLHDNEVQLSARIINLLDTCEGGRLGPEVRTKRTIACLNALWSITPLHLTSPNSQSLIYKTHREISSRLFSSSQDKLFRRSETLDGIATLSSQEAESDSDFAYYAISAKALLRWSFLYNLVAEAYGNAGQPQGSPPVAETSDSFRELQEHITTWLNTTGPDLNSILIETEELLSLRGQSLKEILSDIRFCLLIEFMKDLKKLSKMTSPDLARHTVQVLTIQLPVGSPKSETLHAAKMANTGIPEGILEALAAVLGDLESRTGARSRINYYIEHSAPLRTRSIPRLSSSKSIMSLV